jgi:predicted ATP-dependent endonuclease of OLD family
MDFVATSDQEYVNNYLDNHLHETINKKDTTPLLPRKKVQFIISNYKYEKKLDVKNIRKLMIKDKLNDTFIKDHLHGILAYIDIISTNELDIKIQECIGNRNKITTYYFDIQAIRDKSYHDDIVNLKKDGSNLGTNLFNMVKNMPEFEIISNSLVGTVNEIDKIEVYKIAGSYVIAFEENTKEININQVSDGTINLISTMTALNQPIDHSYMLVFEEPERHLHLKAINYMIEMFRNHNKQILITTHSTEILKHANLEEIIFIYRDEDGDTQSIRADAIPHLKEKMKKLSYERDLTLDELISDGLVSDFL